MEIDVTPEMITLRRKIGASIKKHMERQDRIGADYQLAAIKVVGVLAEEMAVLFGCIGDPVWRQACVAELMRRMPGAVEEAHSRALQRADAETRQ